MMPYALFFVAVISIITGRYEALWFLGGAACWSLMSTLVYGVCGMPGCPRCSENTKNSK